jgi:hypothetical protein
MRGPSLRAGFVAGLAAAFGGAGERGGDQQERAESHAWVIGGARP